VIAGVFYFDFRPVPSADESCLGPACWSAAPGLRICQTASRWAPSAQSPAASADGSACAWDGRLDNRESLFVSRARKFERSSLSNAAAALDLYQSEGTAGLRSLIGDWSLAIWDSPAKTVVLASDYAGVRPLYYRRDPHRLCWSSSLSQLVAWTGAAALDEEFVARFLMSRAVPGRTPYTGIYPVPPGHAVRVSPEGVAVQPFWRLPVHQELRLEDDREYEEALRNLFREAVEARLPVNARVCMELSGGLDSSSIVCMSDRLRNTSAKPVTISYLHAGSRDEPYIRAVERACDLEPVHLDLHDFPLVTETQTGGAFPGWWQPRYAELARRMESFGASVLLTGQLGDFIMGNLGDDSEQVADYLQQRRFAPALREAFAWSQAIQLPVYSIFWRALRTAWFSWTAPTLSDPFSGKPGKFTTLDSLTPRMCALIPLAGAESGDCDEWRGAMPSRRRRFRMFTHILEGRVLQTPEPLQHLSWSHPFAHRPLAEFMLAIPPGQVCRPNQPRRLMRRALASILPPEIVKRKSKAAYAQPFREALLPLSSILLREPARILTVEAGFLERATLLERLERFSQGLDCNEFQLRQILLFEFWLRNREAGRQPFAGTTSSTLAPCPGELRTENVAPI
jgi:asparagine synthase (glutamine-hydrolysing)